MLIKNAKISLKFFLSSFFFFVPAGRHGFLLIHTHKPTGLLPSFFFFLFSFFFLLSSTAQEFCREISDEKAIRLYNQCIDKKNKVSKEQKMRFLKEIVELEPDFAEAHLLLAREMILTANYQGTSISPAEPHLLKVIELCPDYHAEPYYHLGLLSMDREEYDKSMKYYEQFLKFPAEDSKKLPRDYEEKYEFAKGEFEYAKFYAEIFSNKVPYDPKQVSSVSTAADEYLPLITPDNEWMFFTRKTVKQSRVKTSYVESQTKEYLERFSRAKRTDDAFDQGEPLPDPFNEFDSYNYGGATITIDNKHIYLTICKPGKAGYINCDIFSSDYVFSPDSNSSEPYWHWTTLKNLGANVNTEDGWEGQPSISADGNSLYFGSARADSKGIDIYITEKDATGEWKPAKNLGPPINTEYNDKSPFIHSDSQTLYYASQGHLGLGGFDVFYSRMLPNGAWSKPKNIGHPINSGKDEHGFIVSTDGKKVYFSSDLQKKQGTGLDIFSFELYEEARPEKVVFVKGEVKNESDSIVPGAKVELKNLKTKEIKEFKVDTADGTFAAVMTVKESEDVMLQVKAADIAFNSKLISSKDTLKPLVQKINMQVEEVKVDKPYRINEIYYATNSAEIAEESKLILDEFAAYLREHATMKIAIHGHTDDVGDDQSNLALSTDRAFSVMAYLQEKGVDKNLLSHQGFGETRPITPNTSAEARALNRRTEFIILEK